MQSNSNVPSTKGISRKQATKKLDFVDSDDESNKAKKS